MTKILLVEDDKSLREIYGVRLLAEGYDIISAGDGEEALAMAIKERPALIVSDVMMPKISGFDMLDILRSTTETKTIKVIMMTALSSEDQRKRGEELGADRYLVKSQVGIEDVVRTVHEVLEDNEMLSGTSALADAQPAPAPQAFGSQPQQPTPSAEPTAPQAASPAPAPTPSPLFGAPRPTDTTPPARPVQDAPVASPTSPNIQPPASQPSAPAPTTPDPAPVAAEPSQAPAPQPVAPQVPAQDNAAPSSDLPQPTAPFSTNRPGSGSSDRIIHPMERTDEESSDALAARIAAELGGGTAETVSQPHEEPQQQDAPVEPPVQPQQPSEQQFQPPAPEQQQQQ